MKFTWVSLGVFVFGSVTLSCSDEYSSIKGDIFPIEKPSFLTISYPDDSNLSLPTSFKRGQLRVGSMDVEVGQKIQLSKGTHCISVNHRYTLRKKSFINDSWHQTAIFRDCLELKAGDDVTYKLSGLVIKLDPSKFEVDYGFKFNYSIGDYLVSQSQYQTHIPNYEFYIPGNSVTINYSLDIDCGNYLCMDNSLFADSGETISLTPGQTTIKDVALPDKRAIVPIKVSDLPPKYPVKYDRFSLWFFASVTPPGRDVIYIHDQDQEIDLYYSKDTSFKIFPSEATKHTMLYAPKHPSSVRVKGFEDVYTDPIEIEMMNIHSDEYSFRLYAGAISDIDRSDKPIIGPEKANVSVPLLKGKTYTIEYLFKQENGELGVASQQEFEL